MMCVESTCKIRPRFNYPSKSKGIYCSKHKKEGMKDVKHKTCLEEGCKTRPSFNYLCETKGIYCSKHKKEGMCM